MAYKLKEIIVAAKQSVVNLKLLKEQYMVYMENKSEDDELNFTFIKIFFDCFIPIEEMTVKMLIDQKRTRFKSVKNYKQCLSDLIRSNLSDEEALNSGFVKAKEQELYCSKEINDNEYLCITEDELKSIAIIEDKEGVDLGSDMFSYLIEGLNIEEAYEIVEIQDIEEDDNYIEQSFKPLSELHKLVCRGYYLNLRYSNIFEKSMIRNLHRDHMVGDIKTEYKIEDIFMKMVIRQDSEEIIRNYGAYTFAESSKIHTLLPEKSIEVFYLDKTFNNYYEIANFIDRAILNLRKLIYSQQDRYKQQKRYEKTFTKEYEQKKLKEEDNNRLAVQVKELIQQGVKTDQIAEELEIPIRKVYYLKNRK